MTGVIGTQNFPPFLTHSTNGTQQGIHSDFIKRFQQSYQMSHQNLQQSHYMTPFIPQHNFGSNNYVQMHSQNFQSYSDMNAPIKEQVVSQPLMGEEMEISEFLTRSRRKELEHTLAKTTSLSDVIIKSKLKKKLSKSSRGSKFRGVSKNGKKWQVRIQILTTYFRFNSWET